MKTKFQLSLIFTLLTSLITFVFFEVVFDDSYDAFISNMSAFQYTDFSLMDQHYLGILFFRSVYKFIQEFLPQINVFATIYIALSIFSLYYSLDTIIGFIQRKLSLVFAIIICSTVSLLFIENILSITHTRYATIISGVAMVNLFFNKQDTKNLIVHNAMFLIGFLHRPEGGIGVLFIVSVGYLLYKFDLYKLIKGSLFAILCTVTFFTSLYIHKSFTDRFEIKIEPDIEYALSTHRIKPLSEMQNQKDSIRYNMALQGMFIDTSFLNVGFLNDLTAIQYEIDPQVVYDSFENITSLYLYYPVFITIIILFFGLFLYQKKYKYAFYISVFNLFLYILLVYLDYNVDVYHRHFASLLIVSLTVNIVYLAKSGIKENRSILLLFTLTFSVSMYFTLTNSLGNQIQVAEEVRCYEDNMIKVEEKYRDKTIILNLVSFHLLDRNYSFFNKNYTKNQYLIYDLSNYSIVPRNLEYLNKICICDASKPEQFLEWASKSDALFLTNKSRSNIIEEYMKYIHHQDIQFLEIEDSVLKNEDNCLNSTVYSNINFYRLKYL